MLKSFQELKIYSTTKLDQVFKSICSFVFLTLDLSGRYLRKYEIINGDCQILEDNNRVAKKYSSLLLIVLHLSKFFGRIMRS